MEVEQGRVADLALGVVVGVDGGQRQAVQPQVVLGSQFPAAAVVFGFAEQLAVGTVEVGGDMRFGVLGKAELTSCRGFVVQPTPGPAILAGRSH